MIWLILPSPLPMFRSAITPNVTAEHKTKTIAMENHGVRFGSGFCRWITIGRPLTSGTGFGRSVRFTSYGTLAAGISVVLVGGGRGRDGAVRTSSAAGGGAVTGGVVSAGTVAFGAVTVGAVVVGTVAFGAATAGVVTAAGTVAIGAVTVGAVVVGTGALGTVVVTGLLGAAGFAGAAVGGTAAALGGITGTGGTGTASEPRNKVRDSKDRFAVPLGGGNGKSSG